MSNFIEILNDSVEIGGPEYIKIPAKYEICSRCRGEGRIVNPAVDGNGLTAEDFDREGEDFRESYFRGDYDINCPTCEGTRVILIIDENMATIEQIAAYHRHEDEEYQYEMERHAEMVAEYGMNY